MPILYRRTYTLGRTPIHLAARSGSVDCIKYLLRYKSPVDIQDIASMTPLHYAGGYAAYRYVRKLFYLDSSLVAFNI